MKGESQQSNEKHGTDRGYRASNPANRKRINMAEHEPSSLSNSQGSTKMIVVVVVFTWLVSMSIKALVGSST